MTTTLCTLFEGDYHFGVVALANSLHASGFTGTMFCGYRGPRPAWASSDEVQAGSVRLVLLPLETPVHFTNYKPQFMRRIFEELAPGTDSLLYLDPDICVTAPWSFITGWIESGVALSEDLNSPLYENHPRRTGWRQFYARHGLTLGYRGAAYVNGGAVGVTRARAGFLKTWEDVQSLMGAEIGGLSQVKLDGGTSARMRDPFFCFSCSDQDALNAAVEASGDTPLSILGREAMGFTPGLRVLPHALGPRKPWRRRYVSDALHGRPPGPADDAFWRFASGPLSAWPASTPRSRTRSIKIARLIGRFFRAA